MPTICMMATLPVQACIGVGFDLLQVESAKNEQNYGAFRGDVRIGRYLAKGLIGGLESHDYAVRQEVDAKRSGFGGLSYQAGLGWQW